MKYLNFNVSYVEMRDNRYDHIFEIYVSNFLSETTTNDVKMYIQNEYTKLTITKIDKRYVIIFDKDTKIIDVTNEFNGRSINLQSHNIYGSYLYMSMSNKIYIILKIVLKHLDYCDIKLEEEKVNKVNPLKF